MLWKTYSEVIPDESVKLLVQLSISSSLALFIKCKCMYDKKKKSWILLDKDYADHFDSEIIPCTKTDLWCTLKDYNKMVKELKNKDK